MNLCLARLEQRFQQGTQRRFVIAVDALLLSVLVRFAIEIRAYLLLRLPAISSVGNMAATLVCLFITAIAYTDFKPVLSPFCAKPSEVRGRLLNGLCLAATSTGSTGEKALLR